MPRVMSLSLRFSRKFQIAKDDWVGADVLVTVGCDEDEAAELDPSDLRRLAIAEAREAAIELLAGEYQERIQLAARRQARSLRPGAREPRS